jgi:hypothetical protein
MTSLSKTRISFSTLLFVLRFIFPDESNKRYFPESAANKCQKKNLFELHFRAICSVVQFFRFAAFQKWNCQGIWKIRLLGL